MKKGKSNNRVVLIENYTIAADELQFILMKTVIRKRKKTGEEYETEKTLGYYPDLSTLGRFAMKDYMRSGIQDGKWTDVKQMITDTEEFVKRIEEATAFKTRK